MRHLLSIALLLFAFAAVTAPMVGCETSKGAGEDIEDLGEEIQDAAD
jgi:predicted small secreted protein